MYSLLAEHWPSTHKVLGSIPSATKETNKHQPVLTFPLEMSRVGKYCVVDAFVQTLKPFYIFGNPEYDLSLKMLTP